MGWVFLFTLYIPLLIIRLVVGWGRDGNDDLYMILAVPIPLLLGLLVS